MVDFIKRDNNDMFRNPLLGFLFKNKKFLLSLRIAVAALFFYAVYYGFIHPTRNENIFTGAVFWGIFWALFMVVTLSTFGRIFCGICPHGFLGKYISNLGLKKTMPKWMQNRYIGITLLVIGWWGIYYTFPGFWRTPIGTASMFGGMTIVAFIFYFIYKDMSYCKYICPIGTLTRAYDKLSFTKLETYTDSCKDCRTFECATACEYNLKPFTFAKKNQTDDCTLCMDCAVSCEAVKFKITKPAEQLGSKLKILSAEVWTYILIFASIPVSMGFAHGLNRTKIADELIWNKTAELFGMTQYAGGFAFAYAVVFSVFFAVFGIYAASKILKKDYSSTFTNLGVAFIPLFIFASLGHTLETFFIKDYATIVDGFAQGFGLNIQGEALAKRGDAWLHYFGLFKWIGIIWSFILLYKRMKLIDSTKLRKISAYFFASLMILFYIGLNIYTGYVFSKYGAKSRGGHSHGGHASHGNKAMFQSVPLKQATLLQAGEDKTSGVVCGMNLPMFYKTNHSAVLEGKTRQYCSIHCLAEDLRIKKLPLQNIQVVDVTSLKFIPVKTAFYVVGSKQPGTMSRTSKYAFANKADAVNFSKKYGGEIVDFRKALFTALKDFSKKPAHAHGKKPVLDLTQPLYLSLSDPQAAGKRSGGHMHGGGKPKPKGYIPTKKVYLATLKNQSISPENIEFFYYDIKQNKKDIIKKSSMGKESYSFEVPNNGYYNLFAVSKSNKNGKNFYNVAKLEYLQGKHGIDDIYDESLKKNLRQDLTKIDLVRFKNNDEEDFFYKHNMGDTLRFQALLNQTPLSNAKMKIKLQSGWEKVIRTDKNGMAEFTIVRDYFPQWNKFNKRFKQNLLITLEHDTEDTKYTLTYPASFYPNSTDYSSYAYALILITLTLLVSGIVIYRFRANRSKPFSEVKFDG
jgi:nitrous oxide reductase accessory protein NosL/ferredoxin